MVRVSAALAAAGALGALLGLGLWMLASLVPPLSRPRLLARVAPYVLDRSVGARDFVARTPADPTPVLGILVTPALSRAVAGVSRVLGGDASVARRFRQARIDRSVESFRGGQLLAGLVGALVGLTVAVLMWRSTTVSPLLGFAAVPLGGAIGVAVPEQLLQLRAKRRLARMSEELGTVLEFMTLSLSAGETLADALRRVAALSSGEFSGELGAVMTEVGTGASLAASLTRSARDLELPSWSRAVDQLVPALERGTPLVAVLRAQSHDARDERRRHLIEAAGKKEVAMLVPLVFLILPITVLFALWPATLVLDLAK